MSEVFSFTAASRGPLIDELAGRDVPLRLRVVPHGAARSLAREIALRVCSGRVIVVLAPELPVSRALLRVALADSGRIEVLSDEAPEGPLGGYAPLRRIYAEAEVTARTLLALLAPIGGLSATVVTRSGGVMKAAEQLSRPALELARSLLDVPRSVAELLNTPAHDELHTARLLDQLHDAAILEIVQEAAPPQRPSAPPPRPSHSSRAARVPRRSNPPGHPLARAGAARPPRPSTAPEPERLEIPELVFEDEEAPQETEAVPPLLTRGDDLSIAAWSDIGAPPPRRSQPPPASREDQSAAREAADDYATSQAAGLGERRIGWVVLGLVVAVGLLVGLWAGRRGPELPPIERPLTEILVEPEPAGETIVEEDSEYSLSHPPPIAGPEADRRLREAEGLIQAGEYKRAEEILSELREILGDDATVWILSAHLELERGRFERALAHVDRGLAIDPKGYRALVIQGSIFQFQGRVQNAIASYRKALAIDPGHVMSEELRGVAERLERDSG